MKFYILIICSVFCFQLYGQSIIEEDYLDIVEELVAPESLGNLLLKNTYREPHPLYGENFVFILDTNFVNQEYIIQKQLPGFIITSSRNLDFSGINYWLYPTAFMVENNRAELNFITQSFKRDKDAEYIEGKAEFLRSDSIWTLQEVEYHKYEFHAD